MVTIVHWNMDLLQLFYTFRNYILIFYFTNSCYNYFIYLEPCTLDLNFYLNLKAAADDFQQLKVKL